MLTPVKANVIRKIRFERSRNGPFLNLSYKWCSVHVCLNRKKKNFTKTRNRNYIAGAYWLKAYLFFFFFFLLTMWIFLKEEFIYNCYLWSKELCVWLSSLLVSLKGNRLSHVRLLELTIHFPLWGSKHLRNSAFSGSLLLRLFKQTFL